MQFIARLAALPIPPVIVLAIAAIISHLASVALGVMTVQQFRYWDAASIFSFGAMSYIFAFGAVYKSVSLEILLDLAKRPNREVLLSDIVEHQVPNLFRGRTDILVEAGFAECVGSSFVATAAGRKLAARIARLRRAFAIGDTGLYDFSDSTSPLKKTQDL
ncbi:hypothetical protein [Bradyrhizobium canariense]|nr:hypothetical protein [Bradyrhizobium canariense]